METKLNSELQKELTNIKKQIQNIDDNEITTYIQQQIQYIDDSEIKTYIHQQIQNIDDSVIQQQITTINNLVLKQDNNIVALEKKYLKKESYYFHLPFRDYDAYITDNSDKSKDYEYKKYGFTANIRVYSVPNYPIYPKNIFDSDDDLPYQPINFVFRGKLSIEITFPFQDYKIKGQIEINGQINQKGKHKQDIRLSGFTPQTFQYIYTKIHETSDTSDWYFTGEIIWRKNNFTIVDRSKKGSGVNLLKKINEYIGENCYIPTDCYCFIKCVNYITNTDLTKEFQDFINSFQKSNRKGVMTTARIFKFNKKFNTNFQIYNPEDSHFQPKKVLEEFDWVFYLHKEHFCLIRRNNKALGIKEIEDNYDENVWRTCKDDDALMCFAQLKLNVFSTYPITVYTLGIAKPIAKKK
ncbi:hypothetical protein LOTGIDRAFT_168073 [Lottia gigantea]|uniref:Uncharacterized protein n=1 Tax=Lottia gigantea TaxID=225164 RepID=V4B8I7_LOTGI|nr:hypothetical protein LOTGIDRAFT_168073 [Lottia gigantea]ESO85054.1 hypothetical protein LOTGIDRAFT_168073 [Lottia gigantea]